MGDVEIVAHRGHCFLEKLLVLARYPDHLRLRTEKRGNLHRGEHLLFDQREHFFLAVPRIPGLFYPSTPDPSPTDPAGKRGLGDLVGPVGDVLLPVGEIETVRGRGEQLDLLRFDAVVEVLEVIRGEVLAVVDALVVPTEVAEGHAVLHARIMQVGVEQQAREEERVERVCGEEGTRIDVVDHFGEIGHDAIDDLGFARNAERAQKLAENRIEREVREGERADEGAAQLGEEGISLLAEGQGFAEHGLVDLDRLA